MIDEELLNRCIVLTVDEDREQTRAIHRVQREAQTLEGLLRKRKRDTVVKLHRNAQRLLRPLEVVNEHAVELIFPDAMTRTRRDHTKYLSLKRLQVYDPETDDGPLRKIDETWYWNGR